VITIDILHLVDRLEVLLQQGWRLPFTSNVVIQEDAFLDIIDQMRVSIPEEVKQAKRVAAERDRVLDQAQEEAERIVGLAQEQASTLADGHEVVQAAYAKSEEIIAQAHRTAEAVRADADVYVMEELSTLEEQLMKLLTTVRNGIRQVQEASAQREAAQRVRETGGDSSG
jgi:cell division septum initiation protein DivIVA